MDGGKSDICNRVYHKPVYFNFHDRGVDGADMVGAVMKDSVITPLVSHRFINGEPVSGEQHFVIQSPGPVAR